MPGVNPIFRHGPRTMEVSANVAGGQVVEHSTVASTTGLPVVRPAGANSATVMGVATKDAIPVSGQAAYQSSSTAYPGGFPVTDVSVPNETTAVEHDCFIPITFSAAATERAPLKAGANGTVVPLVVGTDAPGLQIGYCAQPGGVASGAVGLARILV